VIERLFPEMSDPELRLWALVVLAVTSGTSLLGLYAWGLAGQAVLAALVYALAVAAVVRFTRHTVSLLWLATILVVLMILGALLRPGDAR
jgi:hypothetical protein